MTDLFDACLNLEDDHIKEGHEDGVRDGRAAGLTEGKELGLQKGLEIGSEVGFYAGFCKALRRPEHAEVLERVQRQVAAIEDLVKRFPLTNPKDDSMQETMIDMRGKYRTVCAKLGIADRMASAEVVQPVKLSLDF